MYYVRWCQCVGSFLMAILLFILWAFVLTLRWTPSTWNWPICCLGLAVGWWIAWVVSWLNRENHLSLPILQIKPSPGFPFASAGLACACLPVLPWATEDPHWRPQWMRTHATYCTDVCTYNNMYFGQWRWWIIQVGKDKSTTMVSYSTSREVFDHEFSNGVRSTRRGKRSEWDRCKCMWWPCRYGPTISWCFMRLMSLSTVQNYVQADVSRCYGDRVCLGWTLLLQVPCHMSPPWPSLFSAHNAKIGLGCDPELRRCLKEKSA